MKTVVVREPYIDILWGSTADGVRQLSLISHHFYIVVAFGYGVEWYAAIYAYGECANLREGLYCRCFSLFY